MGPFSHWLDTDVVKTQQAVEKLLTLAVVVHEDACLSALARVSGAVGLVARQLAAVGGDPVVCEILQAANQGQLVEGVWQPSAEGDPQRETLIASAPR